MQEIIPLDELPYVKSDFGFAIEEDDSLAEILYGKISRDNENDSLGGFRNGRSAKSHLRSNLSVT